ncbi:MAG: NAD(P)/FAD-dependent oxidoreductase [Phycisphaerales bacterium JB050]
MVSENQALAAEYDVVIIGGGPAGTTCASLIKKYNPEISVVILEKAKFPRDHVGESQLPGVSAVLHEMGVWDKVEAANFPVKIGASYTWGREADQWDFDFYPIERYVDEPRPAKYVGQRQSTAFQVDRAVYDEILLRHAEELGTAVFEETRVTSVNRDTADPDAIESLTIQTADGAQQQVRGRFYVDASGAVGLVRRAMEVSGWVPEELKNIAIWDYWQNAEWSVRIGVGATRVQVRSLPYGWIWFIPLGPTRTSIGLICPAAKYKEFGLTPAQLYEKALYEQPEIRGLIKNATSEEKLETTKDWSNIADRLVGTNWFLVGESAGFADPILAAGMNIAHSSARDLAFTILELVRGEKDGQWLRERYCARHRQNINQHIRFAQFWYAANGQFTDLKEHCQKIAKEAGLKLNPDKAWQWLSQGGFIAEKPGHAALGSVDLTIGKAIVEQMDGGARKATWKIEKYNSFVLDIEGAKRFKIGVPNEGRIDQFPAYKRGESTLPLIGPVEVVVKAVQVGTDWNGFAKSVNASAEVLGISPEKRSGFTVNCLAALEALVAEGWVKAKFDPKLPKLREAPSAAVLIRDAKASAEALRERQMQGAIAQN